MKPIQTKQQQNQNQTFNRYQTILQKTAESEPADTRMRKQRQKAGRNLAAAIKPG
jgi:hypothetical protein